jgi:hypothetical protein
MHADVEPLNSTYDSINDQIHDLETSGASLAQSRQQCRNRRAGSDLSSRGALRLDGGLMVAVGILQRRQRRRSADAVPWNRRRQRSLQSM